MRGDVTVEVVLRYLRMRREMPAGTDAVFVVSRDGGYLGCLFIADADHERAEQTVNQIMDTEVPAITAQILPAKSRRCSRTTTSYPPPSSMSRRVLLGRITIDDVVDVIREQASHSVLSMAGLDEDDDMFAPVFVSARRRSIWLGVNLATAFLAAWVAGLFEATLDRVVMLAVLMPIVPSMGGIAGTQTLILITRGLALGQVERSNARWLLTQGVRRRALQRGGLGTRRGGRNGLVVRYLEDRPRHRPRARS